MAGVGLLDFANIKQLMQDSISSNLDGHLCILDSMDNVDNNSITYATSKYVVAPGSSRKGWQLSTRKPRFSHG